MDLYIKVETSINFCRMQTTGKWPEYPEKCSPLQGSRISINSIKSDSTRICGQTELHFFQRVERVWVSIPTDQCKKMEYSQVYWTSDAERVFTLPWENNRPYIKQILALEKNWIKLLLVPGHSSIEDQIKEMSTVRCIEEVPNPFLRKC